MNLYETLRQYRDSGRCPMHMPGHKRNPEFTMENPYSLDVTEVEGTDNLHHPTGVIRKLQEKIARRCHAKDSFVLVNGSTCGILAAVSACCRRGDTVLMARNCHRAVYHAVYLLQLKPVYLVPEQDGKTGISLGIDSGQVEQACRENPGITCVIITSPTYEGVLSDIGAIAETAHRNGAVLIVDEAHGAHLSWGENMPAPAMEQGADLVVESLHKTLPALTQTAVLHRCSDWISKECICRYLDIYETSSPSYVLMASVAQCVDWLDTEGQKAFERYAGCLKEFREQAKSWNTLFLWEIPEKEPSKIVVCTGKIENFTGTDLANILRSEYNIEIEMAAGNYVIAMTSVGDTEEGLGRLMRALSRIDEKISQKEMAFTLKDSVAGQERKKQWLSRQQEKPFLPKQCVSAYDAMNGRYEEIPLNQSGGRISAEYAFVYPPGIPFLVPGEEIDTNVLRQINQAKEKKLELLGLADEKAEKIRVLPEESQRMAGSH